MERLVQSPELERERRIAGCIAVRGEADRDAELETAETRGKAIHLPRIAEHKGIVSEPWRPRVKMHDNRTGIPEPEPGDSSAAADTLDFAIVPLVAFDATRTRIGSGASHHDRAYDFRRSTARSPFAGFASAFQVCPHPPRAEWDVPIDRVVTGRGIRRFSTSAP